MIECLYYILFKRQERKCTIISVYSKFSCTEWHILDRVSWKWGQTQGLPCDLPLRPICVRETSRLFKNVSQSCLCSWLRWVLALLFDHLPLLVHLLVRSVSVWILYTAVFLNPDGRPTEKKFASKSHQSFIEHRLPATLLKYWTSIDFHQRTWTESISLQNTLLLKCMWQLFLSRASVTVTSYKIDVN